MQGAEKISVTLTPDLLRRVRESVESGEYASTSEALRDAVRIWHCQRLNKAERLAVIRARVRHSFEDTRPSLTETEVDIRLRALFFETGARSDGSG